MGTKTTVDLLPEHLRKRIIELLKDPTTTQQFIVDMVNVELGEKVLSKSAVNRFARKQRKQELATVMSPEISLARIADSLETLIAILKTWDKPRVKNQNSGLLEAEKHEILWLFLAGYSLSQIGKNFKDVLSEYFGSYDNALTIRKSIERTNLKELASLYDKYCQQKKGSNV